MPTTAAVPFIVPATLAEDDARDLALRHEIVQVLLTTPGERVNLPEFGCGLLALVFEPLDPILAAAVEFSAGQSLARWLGDRLEVLDVDVRADPGNGDPTVEVEVTYRAAAQRATRSLRLAFS
jgi:phage baseplate assembly protein W